MNDEFDLPPFLLSDGDSATIAASGSGDDRRATLRPSSGDRATPDQLEALHELQHLTLDIRSLLGRQRDVVQEARMLGMSWGLIGYSVGLTAEGARQKYGDPARPRLSGKRRK